jgi:hypothetical protein
MPRDLDTRDYSFRRDANNFAAAAATASVSSALPGDHEVEIERMNPFTGSPINLRSVNAASELGLMPSPGPTEQI